MRIIFEFAGGPMDGKTVVGQLGEQDEADRYYALTHHGRVSQRFRVASSFAIEMLANEDLKEERPHQFQQHSYRVSDRLEGDDEVLVRVEYVGKEGKASSKAAALSGPAAVQPPQSLESTVETLLAETAQALGRSYSHYWPAPDRSARDVTTHLSHVLLSRDFSVFVDAPLPETPDQTIDLLGVAPSQDWFAACQVRLLNDMQLLPLQLMDDVSRLEHFWLHRGLTSDFAQRHTERLARHCQHGLGFIAYLYGSSAADDADPVLALWRQEGQPPDSAAEVAARLGVLGARWIEPRLVRRFDSEIAFYLLGVHFSIRRA